MNGDTELLTGVDFRRMIAGAYRAFLREHEYINSLNVFPVPDGDTGTNMLLTIGGINQMVVDAGPAGIGRLSRLAADSAIMGARGNSGVILAQLFRGVARALAGKETATASELGKAFQYGILYAYRAVARPVEGTILTVAKGIAKGAHRAVRERRMFADILAQAIQAGEAELARTPDLLPALKAAGVVDAGGQGLIVLLAGCLEGFTCMDSGPEADFARTLITVDARPLENLAHPYCTEFIVMHPTAGAASVKQQLETFGESLIVAKSEDAIKVHIHTAHPGGVLETALVWGTLHDIKIENMADQHRPLTVVANKAVKLAVISVSPGPGLTELMLRLGALTTIDGGQTMNPPVEQFVNAVHNGPAEQYIILPNNSNIILAAVQAQKLLGDKVAVVATRNVPQGLAALLAFNAADSIDNNVKNMLERCGKIRAAGVTTAVRSSRFAGRRIVAGQYIGVADNKVLVAENDLEDALGGVIKELITADAELISLYYGGGLDKEAAERLAAVTAAAFADLEVELYYGGQPYYKFIVSVE